MKLEQHLLLLICFLEHQRDYYRPAPYPTARSKADFFGEGLTVGAVGSFPGLTNYENTRILSCFAIILNKHSYLD